MRFLHFDLRRVRAAGACAVMLLAMMAKAATPGFSDGLSAEERAACGLTKLTAPQVAALNGLVDRDVTLAHQGGVTGFSSTFAARRTPRERAAAGLDRLSEKQRTVLDSLAARTIAMGPPPLQAFAYAPPPPVPPTDTLVSAPLGAEVHGDLSFTIGGGSHGSSFYGSSMDLFVTDPSGKFTLGIGVSEYRGKGFFGPYGPFCPIYAAPPLLEP
jgi:hypothetical protein